MWEPDKLLPQIDVIPRCIRLAVMSQFLKTVISDLISYQK